ncbi:MAG: hypothetical protein HYR56_15740 [Acidobacteria bacterium]|nr:hypothetical protein [Acidobacteriota bacterium]
MKSLLVGIKNVLLWSYARGTWQYDVLCALIVLTLLFWPNSRVPKTIAAAGKAAVQMEDGLRQRDIEWQALRDFLQQQKRTELLNSPHEAVVYYLQMETKTVIKLSSVEPFGDAEGRIGYRVHYRTN